MTRIALVDGPLPEAQPRVHSRIDIAGPPLAGSPAERHAVAMAGIILAHAPDACLVSIALFAGRLVASASQLALALTSARQSGAAVVHCSIGLQRPAPEVVAATKALLDAGTVVVAATPARGARTWPAAVPGVVAVQGDARCTPDAWSLIGPGLRFGACPGAAAFPDVGGASTAAAHFTGLLAACPDLPAQAVAEMTRTPAFRGPERRGLPQPPRG